MPAARQVFTTDWNMGLPPAPPHELFTTLGRLAGSPPGASIQSAQLLRSDSAQEREGRAML